MIYVEPICCIDIVFQGMYIVNTAKQISQIISILDRIHRSLIFICIQFT